MKTKIYDAPERPLGFSSSEKNATLKTVLVTLQCIRSSQEILTKLAREMAAC